MVKYREKEAGSVGRAGKCERGETCCPEIEKHCFPLALVQICSTRCMDRSSVVALTEDHHLATDFPSYTNRAVGAIFDPPGKP